MGKDFSKDYRTQIQDRKHPKSEVPPSLQTDYKKFTPVDALISKRGMQAFPNNKRDNLTFRHLHKTPEGFKGLADRLKELGILSVASKMHIGSDAIVLEANNNQMIRITSFDCDEGTDSGPGMLKILSSHEFPEQGYRFDVLPKVHTLAEIIASPELRKEYGLPEQEAEARKAGHEYIRRLRVDNWKKDLFLWDGSFKNVALVKDKHNQNVPLIIDFGAVIHWEDAGQRQCRRFEDLYCGISEGHKQYLSSLKGNLPNVISQCLDHEKQHFSGEALNYKAAQTAHRERLGLPDEGITGVLDMAALEEKLIEFEKVTARMSNGNHSTPLYQEVLSTRTITPGQLGAAAHSFSPNLEGQGKSKGFCDHLRERLINDDALPRK